MNRRNRQIDTVEISHYIIFDYIMGYRINIKKFDMSKERECKSIIIIGKNASGKSFLIKDILSRQNFSDGTIIAGTDNNKQFYSEFVPSEAIHGKFSPKLTSEVMKKIKKIGIGLQTFWFWMTAQVIARLIYQSDRSLRILI